MTPAATRVLDRPSMASSTSPARPPAAIHAPASAAMGTLRGLVTLLVLVHHSVLAYHPFAPAPAASLLASPQWWPVFPIVDSSRWTGFALLVGFNDTFFMSLMFFLSGLFLWPSLQRKGTGRYLRERARRLGIPFVASVLVLAPLAYYPSYLQTGQTGISGFVGEWLSLGFLPAGPAWFLWLLLGYGSIIAGVARVAPAIGPRLGRLAGGAARRPWRFAAGLLLASAATYVPMAIAFNALAWATWGPLAVQTSRVVHYFVYLLAGMAVGARGLERGLLSADGRLARRWLRCVVGALLAFAVGTVVTLISLDPQHPLPHVEAIAAVAFVVSCAGIAVAALAVASRFLTRPGRLALSLRDNAYAMYLLHYAIATWLQYALLPAALPALAKGVLVVAMTIVLSWSLAAGVRRVAWVRRLV